MLFRFLKKFYIIKYVLKELEKIVVFNYLNKNFKHISKIFSNFIFLFVILFTMLSLSLYLETDVETFIKENNANNEEDNSKKKTSFTEAWNMVMGNKDLDVKEKNLVSWGGWDVSNNILTKSETEPSGSYEQLTNNNKHIPENENYELDWWRWPKSELIDGENTVNDSPCRAGTKICNKIQNNELINHADTYTTSTAYKTAS